MDVNVLITSYNTEEHIQYLLNIIQQFKIIKPTICIVYSGTNAKQPCHVRIQNTKENSRELAMIVEGMKWFKSQKTKTSRYLKLGAHVWPMNEQKIIDIFNEMDKIRRPFAGNVWHHNLPGSIAADFFLLNTDYGNIFGNVTQVTNDTEVTIHRLLKDKSKSPYIIPERDPVFWSNYWECKKLGLLMRPKVEDNLESAKELALEEEIQKAAQ